MLMGLKIKVIQNNINKICLLIVGHYQMGGN
jgi:hypothetical protein